MDVTKTDGGKSGCTGAESSSQPPAVCLRWLRGSSRYFNRIYTRGKVDSRRRVIVADDKTLLSSLKPEADLSGFESEFMQIESRTSGGVGGEKKSIHIDASQEPGG